MKQGIPYEIGQRWRLHASKSGFEDTLVIADIDQNTTEKPIYTLYVKYESSTRVLLRPGKDGEIFLTDEYGLDRSVVELLETNVELPWWWKYARRDLPQGDGPRWSRASHCDPVSSVLSLRFDDEKLAAEKYWPTARKIENHFEVYKAKQLTRGRSMSVAESWERIEAWSIQHRGYPMSLNPGATGEAITDFESAIQLKLPDDFKQSVAIHDGGSCSIPPNGGDFLSLNQIEEQWRMYSDWRESRGYAAGEDWIPRHIKGPIKPVFWNPKRICITDNSGDHLTLDLDPPDNGKYGQILDHSHEVGPISVVASSWSEFLWRLANDLESGLYIVFENGDVELLEEVQRLLNDY